MQWPLWRNRNPRNAAAVGLLLQQGGRLRRSWPLKCGCLRLEVDLEGEEALLALRNFTNRGEIAV